MLFSGGGDGNLEGFGCCHRIFFDTLVCYVLRQVSCCRYVILGHQVSQVTGGLAGQWGWGGEEELVANGGAILEGAAAEMSTGLSACNQAGV